MTNYRILAINPGSTSTKLAVYDNEQLTREFTIRHNPQELSQYGSVAGQFAYRKHLITQQLAEAGIELASLSAVIGRGGLVEPIESGIYTVNDKLKEDLHASRFGEHASNLGGLIADELASELGIPAFIADPVVVDELMDVARVTGMPELERVSIFHALNHKAVARNYARTTGRKYEDMNLVVAHLGGGISVGAHEKGRVIDVNNALDGEGPFSPERAGTLPAGQLVKLALSGEFDYPTLKKKITGNGGLLALIGTNHVGDIVDRIDAGDEKARLMLDAMSYGIAKAIGSMAVSLKGEVDAIILTGGIAYNPYVNDYVIERVSFLGEVVVIPGENELEALALNALSVLRGETEPRIYG